MTVEAVGSVESKNEVLSKWLDAGRQRQTPMNDREIVTWGAELFPHLRPQCVLDWIAADSPSCDGLEGRVIRFSKSSLDMLLRQICIAAKPIPLSESAQFLNVDQYVH